MDDKVHFSDVEQCQWHFDFPLGKLPYAYPTVSHNDTNIGIYNLVYHGYMVRDADGVKLIHESEASSFEPFQWRVKSRLSQYPLLQKFWLVNERNRRELEASWEALGWTYLPPSPNFEIVRCPFTTVVIVRHAEKVTEDPYDPEPPLTDDGEKRAETLARMLKDLGVSAIFSTNTTRTIETVNNTGENLPGITIRHYAYSWAGVQQVTTWIKSEYVGKVVLVAGHRDTVPATIGALGISSAPQIGPDEYDNLFIVVICHNGRALLTHLKYVIDHDLYECKENKEDP